MSNKILIKRGYKRFQDFNHNTLIIMFKEWSESEISLDFYYNDKFIKYLHVERTWNQLFEANAEISNDLIASLMLEDRKLASYSNLVSTKMELVEQNILLDLQGTPYKYYVNIYCGFDIKIDFCKAISDKDRAILTTFHVDRKSELYEIIRACEVHSRSTQIRGVCPINGTHISQ